MSGPVAVDATVRAMVELINRTANDAAFRQLCKTDMAAAVARLETAPSEGTTFEYADDAGDRVLRVHRGGKTTTVTRTADGRLTIDNDALGVSTSSNDDFELSDAELLAVSGGGDGSYCDSQPTAYLRKACKAIYVCFGQKISGWYAASPCISAVSEVSTEVFTPQAGVTCMGYNSNGWSMLVSCDQTS